MLYLIIGPVLAVTSYVIMKNAMFFIHNMKTDRFLIVCLLITTN